MDETLKRPGGSKGQPVMVERIARAIRKASYGTERGWHYDVHEAWAVLEAIREPTVEMLDAAEATAFVGYTGTSSIMPDKAWKAMIAEAMRLPDPAKVADPA